jgi:TetR/AcrR family transcriptional regulator, regulator of cefoperazone and chloramphenicol sensitivity
MDCGNSPGTISNPRLSSSEVSTDRIDICIPRTVSVTYRAAPARLDTEGVCQRRGGPALSAQLTRLGKYVCIVRSRHEAVYADSVPDPAFPRGQLGGELATTDQICLAAMKCFAANGIESGSLRMVAKIAGVSVGFVQNRFDSKAALVDAVNERLVAILSEVSQREAPGPPPVTELSGRAITLLAEYPDAADYLGQLLLTDHPTGCAIFDDWLASGTAQCREMRGQDRSRHDDLDITWRALHPLLLVLATLVLRSHIERQLPEPLSNPSQRRRWESGLELLIGACASEPP